MALYNEKKYEHKKKADQGKSFGKSYDYVQGRKKAKEMAKGKESGEKFRKKNGIKKALSKAKLPEYPKGEHGFKWEDLHGYPTSDGDWSI